MLDDSENVVHATSSSDVEEKEEVRESVNEEQDEMMCRVCRSGQGSLYYPCLCTGSIKYVHQECLTEWLKYSKKDVCELCNYKYSFQAIYREDMPKALPINDIIKGVVINMGRFLKTWIVYSIVVVSWLGLVPLTAARIYNAVFYSSFYEFLAKPTSVLRTDFIFADICKGACILIIFLCVFISLVWLREQIVHSGPQDFLEIVRPEAADGNANQRRGQQEGDRDDDEGSIGGSTDDEEGHEDLDMHNLLPDDEGFVGDGAMFMDRLAGEQEEEREEANEAPQQEDNWRDWDRLGDELTWQRLLGLDGSFVFLEHVFWVISLNTLFTIAFAYTPYRLGYIVLDMAGIQQKLHYFPSIVAILAGYFMIACFFYVLHAVVGLLKIKSAYRFLGICFLILKVFLLVLLEIGIFPIICGCWIDLCSLDLIASTLSGRIASFASTPVSAVFIHWMIGMIYVFYSASYVVLLREVLRPGVLWFMRNLNDPEFNPIQEMIELPVSRHVQRLIVSTSLFFSTIFLMLYLPLRIVRRISPKCLPYNISISADTPLNELSLELLLLQVVLPALLEQTQARSILKRIVKKWCEIVGDLLGIRKYLLPDADIVIPPPHNVPDLQNGAVGLAAEHQAMLLIREPQATAYVDPRPIYFPLRIAALITLMSVTGILISSFCFYFPVTIGRSLMYYVVGLHNVHDLYTVGSGLYLCYVMLRLGILLVDWFNQGVDAVKTALISYIYLAGRLLVVLVPLLLFIPLLMGTYFQLVLVTPLRLDYNQSALFFMWQDWAMGVLHLKICCAFIMMGPDWWLKTACERIYADGINNLNARRILVGVILPIILFLGGLLSVPYVIARIYILITGADLMQAVVILRIIYPCSLILMFVCIFARVQYDKLMGLTEVIRNEKYLLGTQLVNYEREPFRFKVYG